MLRYSDWAVGDDEAEAPLGGFSRKRMAARSGVPRAMGKMTERGAIRGVWN